MKLHLGCGQTYLDGYLNVDFPSSEHQVQSISVADRHADLTQLRFARNTVDEVRLHHVFEHFRRPEAAALMASWNSWMREGAVLHIEVPDLGRMAWIFANPFASRRARAVAERHLFGSHEAKWAAHYEGYDAAQMKSLFHAMGFAITQIKRTHWRGTHNLHVFGRKATHFEHIKDALPGGRDYLNQFRVDDTEGELKMVDLWMQDFGRQLEKTWASD